jgi:succinate dehydrogenase / fumarate reductase membrane anchor subunit
MGLPYVSDRTGRAQWLLQRVSAVLLVILAGSHFALQHFSRDAVSTGLTVSWRMNEPLWQGYYALFVVLALYHGVNGLIGILADYAPKPKWRLKINWTLWTLAAFFAFAALGTIMNPRPTAAVKDFYATNGFASGEAYGPLNPVGMSYDVRAEIRELHMFAFYLERHTHRTDDGKSIAEIFGAATADGAGSPNHPEGSAELAAVGGASFQAWALDQVADLENHLDQADRHTIFSSTGEFALWALHVRRVNNAEQPDRQSPTVAAALADLPAYDAGKLY